MLNHFQLVIIVQLWIYCKFFLAALIWSEFKKKQQLTFCFNRVGKELAQSNRHVEACTFCIYPPAHHIQYIQFICIETHSVDNESLAQTTQETIPFTTVAFSVYGFLLMCSLAFLCRASSLRRLWLGENCLCLLQHTSKRALLRKGKVLREPADCIPIMHHCLLDITRQGNT